MGKTTDWSKESYRDGEKLRGYRMHSSNRRSSEHRNEEPFEHSKNNYDYSGDKNYKKYRNQSNSDYHRHSYYRSDRKRSRSRSVEREYEYESRNTDRYEHNRHNHKDNKKEVPNNTLMIRNLPSHATDKDITAEIGKYGLFPKDVRLMKNKETGQSRGFAFIEFTTIEQATQLKNSAQDFITIDGEYDCSLHFSFPKDMGIDKNNLKNDWSCLKCGINNFKRRDECFKCGTSKETDMLAIENANEVINQPTNVLLLRNLSPSTTEERVLTIIGTLTTLPIKSIRFMLDNTYLQSNICFLELHSVFEATELFKIITSISNGFIIDDCIVDVSYGHRAESLIAFESLAGTRGQCAASTALAAAQWKNLDDSQLKKKKNKPQTNNLGTIILNGVEFTKYNPPDYNSFQYDTNLGFYYDSSTGFHYDPNSQYFYNSQTQKYMYFDTTNQVYVAVNSDGKISTLETTEINAPNEETKKEGEEKLNKAKLAKKIAKDMEKWAKKLQKKELPQRSQFFQQSEVPEETEPSTPCLFETEVKNSTEIASTVISKNIDPFDMIKSEEERLIDRIRLACLLCKRQFNSSELLDKHQQLSDLHKTNLTMLRKTILNEEQLEHVEKVERDLGYRDRAKERRQKFGIDDTPEYSKLKFEADKNTMESLPPQPIANDNIGNRMLRAMGWTEGSGLGKSNQGLSNIIEVERRKSGLGLGSSNATFSNSKESYKDAVRRTALQRFKQLNENNR